MNELEKLKESIFWRLEDAVLGAYLANKNIIKQNRCIAKYNVLLDIVEENNLLNEYAEWKERKKEKEENK